MRLEKIGMNLQSAIHGGGSGTRLRALSREQ